MSAFSKYARYYDLLYQDKDYKAEADYFLGIVNKYGRPNSTAVLEYGAGTGNHQIFFNQMGFSTTGVELSREMCEIGRERGASLIEADITNYRHYESVDAVLALFHVVSYIIDDDDLAQMFSGASENLLPGGVFVFDIWFEDAVLSQKPEVRVKRASSPFAEVVRIAEPRSEEDNKKTTVDYTVFGRERTETKWSGFSESHVLRSFSESDLGELARSSGLQLVQIEETLTGVKPSDQTWGVTAVLRK